MQAESDEDTNSWVDALWLHTNIRPQHPPEVDAAINWTCSISRT